jgi:hypothetical protein
MYVVFECEMLLERSLIGLGLLAKIMKKSKKGLTLFEISAGLLCDVRCDECWCVGVWVWCF